MKRECIVCIRVEFHKGDIPLVMEVKVFDSHSGYRYQQLQWQRENGEWNYFTFLDFHGRRNGDVFVGSKRLEILP